MHAAKIDMQTELLRLLFHAYTYKSRPGADHVAPPVLAVANAVAPAWVKHPVLPSGHTKHNKSPNVLLVLYHMRLKKWLLPAIDTWPAVSMAVILSD